MFCAMRPLGLLRLLLLIALMLAPVGMVARHAAMAAPPAKAVDLSAHCADVAGGHDEMGGDEVPGMSVDCMLACACIPPTGSPGLATKFLSQTPLALPTASLVSGHGPQADPPPPRSF